MSNYLIGVGGTGMRCLESFVHLCAAGMMDSKEVHMLLLDTDFHNGNKSRTRELINTYISLRNTSRNKENPESGSPLKDSLFSAKITLHEFYSHFQGERSSFRKITANVGNISKDVKEENETLVNLFFDKNTQNFDLEHGYRAQTHIGSYLMYHEIVDHVRRVKGNLEEKTEGSLYTFIEKLIDDQDAKVFILGSIFGGTGASCIPILPEALEKASAEMNSGVKINSLTFGTTLLSNYFSFNSPSDDQLTQDKVVATSQRFALNSQAALMFYNQDETVKKVYQHLYLLGWPSAPLNYSKAQTGSKVLTGGKSQTNTSHALELMAAFAGYDFFKKAEEGKIEYGVHNWLYKSVIRNKNYFDFSFADFAGENESKRLEKKLTTLFALALMIQKDFNGSSEALYKVLYKGSAQKAMDDHLGGKDGIASEDFAIFDKYLSDFAYGRTSSNTIVPGYLLQLQASVIQDDFLFNADMFKSDLQGLAKVKWLRLPKAVNKHVKRRLLNRTKPEYDAFATIFREKEFVRPDNAIAKPIEKYINWCYNAMATLFNL